MEGSMGPPPSRAGPVEVVRFISFMGFARVCRRGEMMDTLVSRRNLYLDRLDCYLRTP